MFWSSINFDQLRNRVESQVSSCRLFLWMKRFGWDIRQRTKHIKGRLLAEFQEWIVRLQSKSSGDNGGEHSMNGMHSKNL